MFILIQKKWQLKLKNILVYGEVVIYAVRGRGLDCKIEIVFIMYPIHTYKWDSLLSALEHYA